MLCFHGTDEKTANNILNEGGQLSASQNDYDWLGHGIYFWEYSPQRAHEFAREKFRWQKQDVKAAVIGAIIDPGLCLNLLSASALGFLEAGYQTLRETLGDAAHLPENGKGKEIWKRKLDCAVINMVHSMRAKTQTLEWGEKNKNRPPLPSYDSVRGAFWEGGPVYPHARIEKKTHIQICVRNPECIKGYFRPIEQ